MSDLNSGDLLDKKLALYRELSLKLDALETETPGITEAPAADDPAADEAPAPEPEPAEPTIYAAPDSNDTNILKALLGKFKGGLKPGQSVVKGDDGKRHMLIVTSNSYRDREGETLTSEALQKDVDRHWAGEVYMGSNPLLYWHEDKAVVGEIVWGDLVGPFYVEVARESDSLLSKHYFDYREAHPEQKWGASHRFAYPRQARDGEGVFHQIRKVETTTLPLEAAANLLTISEVIPMSDKRNKVFDDIFFEGAYDLLKTQGIDALSQKLAENGIEHKSTDETEESLTAKMVSGFTALIDDVTELSDTVEGLKAERATEAQAIAEKQTTLDTELTAVKALAEQLKEQLAARPKQASLSSATALREADLTEQLKDAVREPVKKMWQPLQEGS